MSRKRTLDRFSGARILLDTGPLWDFIITQAAQENRWNIFKPDYFKDIPTRNKFNIMIVSSIRLITTPGIIGEIQKHSREYFKKFRRTSDFKRKQFSSSFWRTVISLFKEWKLEEISVDLLSYSDELWMMFGPVDWGIFEAAYQLNSSGKRTVVITTDNNLNSLCRNHSIETHLLEGILREL